MFFLLQMVFIMSIIFSATTVYASNKKVVVIGAGLSGLTTAYRLYQQGIDVEVYEARNRVGGRVFTVNVGGNIAELGGKNVSDGGQAENLYALINEFGLEVSSNRVNLNMFYCAEQELISLQECLMNQQFDPQELRQLLTDLALQSRNMQEVLGGLIDEHDPLYKMIAMLLTAYEGGALEELSPIYIETLYHMLLGGICAAHPEGEVEESYMDLVNIKDGNGSLPEKIAAVLGERLHCNKQFTHVAKDNNDVLLLTFADGQQINADVLVLTNPCPTYTDIIFEDNIIPSERLEAIRCVHYGTNAKILIPFSCANVEIINVTNGQAGSWFDGIDNIVTLFCTDQASKFAPDTIVDVYNQYGSLLVEKGFVNVAQHSSIYPVCAQDRAFACYDGAVGHSWPTDPYVKGSYSYIAAGQEDVLTAMHEENGEMVKSLFAPIDQHIYFAGEHTSILMEVPGTMEAACESGERAARMILKNINS